MGCLWSTRAYSKSHLRIGLLPSHPNKHHFDLESWNYFHGVCRHDHKCSQSTGCCDRFMEGMSFPRQCHPHFHERSRSDNVRGLFFASHTPLHAGKFVAKSYIAWYYARTETGIRQDVRKLPERNLQHTDLPRYERHNFDYVILSLFIVYGCAFGVFAIAKVHLSTWIWFFRVGWPFLIAADIVCFITGWIATWRDASMLEPLVWMRSVGDDGPHPTDPVICLYSRLGFGEFSLYILLWEPSMYLACTS